LIIINISHAVHQCLTIRTQMWDYIYIHFSVLGVAHTDQLF